MFDPSDYQNVNGASSGVTGFLGGSGGQTGNTGAANGNWLSQAGSWLGSDSMGQGMGIGGMNNGQMILAADQMGGQLFGMLAGKNQSVAGNIMKGIPGLSTIGNLWNAAFGSYINEEFVDQTNQGINAMRSKTFASNTNADVLNDWKSMISMSNVEEDEVGSDGWFSSEAEDTTNELNRNINKANQLAIRNFGHAVRNADANTDLRIAQGMTAAYGGPINSFRKYYNYGGNLYDDGGLFGNETVDTVASFLPILGTAEDAYTFYKNPSWANAGWLALSLGSDIFTGGMAARSIKALRMANKAHDAAQVANRAARRTWEAGKAANTAQSGSVRGADMRRMINSVKAAGATRQAAIRRANDALLEAGVATGVDQGLNGFINAAQTDYLPTFGYQHSKGGYLNQAKALIKQNEGWSTKPYADSPKGKQWRSVGYGFNDSGFRDKYPEGISKHYEHGITKKQAEEELDYFLNKAEKQLKSIYGKQWNDFTDNQKAAILDTYYQRPASVGKSSRFYKAVTAGEDAGKYLGVAGYSGRNKIRQGVFGGSQDYVNLGAETENPSANSSSLQEVTPFTPVIQDLDLSGITPTQVRAPQISLNSPTFDLSMFGSTPTQQESYIPTVGTVEDFLASYGDFDDALFACGGKLRKYDGGGWMDFFQAWNQAQGGNNYFGQGNGNWRPSDGLQRNTSNGSAQDWIGVAGTVVNTIDNWGEKDPSLGRGGGYSQFGMAAYDLMKGIRNATKSKRESISQKLGIPVYARGGRLFAEGGSTGEGVGAMGYAQIGTAALKLASNVAAQTKLDVDEDKVKRSIDRFGMGLDDAIGQVNTNGDLLDLWNNATWMQGDLSGRDFRDKSLFDDFLDSYAASWEGFNAGQNFGPWGAAIGAIVGGGSSVIGSIIGRNKADDAAEEANERIEKANERITANLLSAADRVDRENDLRILQNMDNQGASGGKLSMGFGLKNPFVIPDGIANPLYKAFGGGLTHGMDWDTGINWVDEGGSHGENPLGGVPMGVDEQGIPNLVEEGEAIWNGDYVFSKRMKVPKKLREKYHLPEDATFADAVEKLTKNSEERPLSAIDRNTQDHILGEFADTQEEMRMAKAQRAMEKQQQLRDDFLMGMQFGLGGHMSSIGIVPDSDNVSLFDKLENAFADGGGIHIDPSKKGTFKAQASKMGMGVQEAASHILANKEDYSPAMVKKANFAKNFAHAFGGSLFDNPFGEVNTFDFGGDLKTRRDTIMRNNGVTEEQANAMLFRMLSKEDRGKAIKERVFGTWTPTYNSNNEIVVPAAATSNRGNVNGRTSQSASSSKAASQKSAAKPKAASSVSAKPKGATGLNLYDWYRNGSDGISEPTGFKVGENGKAYDYTPEYKALVDKLTADDIRKWAAEHPDDPSLKSFLEKGNDLSKLTDDQWRTGATDGKYGFMHHVADQIGKEQAGTRAMTDEEFASEYPMIARPADETAPIDWTDGSIWGNEGTTKAAESPAVTIPKKTPFKPKQTWTRNVPWIMSGIMGLKEMLTPVDYGNADSLLDAAYRTGQPISVGTEYIGDYRKRDPFDERYLMDIINQRGAATNRNMMNLSGGNRAVAMSGILANDLTTQMSLAEAARQAYLANREDDAKVAEFNRGTNIFNAQAQNTRNLSLAQLNSNRQHAMLSGIAQGARLRQAIKDQRDAAISANLSAFAQGLGDLGKENGYYNMLGGLNDEGILKYFYGDNWRTKFNNTQEEV